MRNEVIERQDLFKVLASQTPALAVTGCLKWGNRITAFTGSTEGGKMAAADDLGRPAQSTGLPAPDRNRQLQFPAETAVVFPVL